MTKFAKAFESHLNENSLFFDKTQKPGDFHSNEISNKPPGFGKPRGSPVSLGEGFPIRPREMPCPGWFPKHPRAMSNTPGMRFAEMEWLYSGLRMALQMVSTNQRVTLNGHDTTGESKGAEGRQGGSGEAGRGASWSRHHRIGNGGDRHRQSGACPGGFMGILMKIVCQTGNLICHIALKHNGRHYKTVKCDTR